MLIKIAALLNVSIDELIGHEIEYLCSNNDKLISLSKLVCLEINRQEYNKEKRTITPHEWLGLIMARMGEMSEIVNEINVRQPIPQDFDSIRSLGLKASALIVRFLEDFDKKQTEKGGA